MEGPLCWDPMIEPETDQGRAFKDLLALGRSEGNSNQQLPGQGVFEFMEFNFYTTQCPKQGQHIYRRLHSALFRPCVWDGGGIEVGIFQAYGG